MFSKLDIIIAVKTANFDVTIMIEVLLQWKNTLNQKHGKMMNLFRGCGTLILYSKLISQAST